MTVTLPRVKPTKGPVKEKVCHTLDEEQRALCFADVSDRTPHARIEGEELCSGCGRPICPTCKAIEEATRGR